MNEIVNQLAQSLFRKNSLQECSRWELEILAEHYPYFGVAQFLIAGKMKDENADSFDRQLEKTSLYFTNPLWLDYIINDRENGKTESRGAEPTVESADMPIAEAAVQPDPYVQEAAEVSQIEDQPVFLQPVIVDEPGPVQIEEIVLDDHDAAEVSQIEDQPVFLQTAAAVEPGPGKIEEIVLNEHEAAEVSQIEDQPVFQQREEALQVADSNSVQEFVAETRPASNGQSEEAEQVTEEETSDDNDPALPQEEIKMRSFTFDPIQPSNIKAPLAFEPYHTVDYFASQGIKMVQQEIPRDRFDQQLKSFTQWLKTIKKVPVAEITKDMVAEAEQKIITLAEHSIEDREVVTEVMAEVWAKQGDREKAIGVYNKLSLQNPAKSAYFAGLIEQLKQA